jgi:hypothetical protein
VLSTGTRVSSPYLPTRPLRKPAQKGTRHIWSRAYPLFMLNRRHVDTSAYLVLWQVGVAGDRSFARFSTDSQYRQVLVDVLARDYDLAHEVTIYRAATLPMQDSRIDRLPLGQLPDAAIDMHVTLVIPPSRPLEPDLTIRERLDAIDEAAVP